MNVHYTHRVSVYWPTQHKKRRHHIVSVAKSFWESLEAKRVSGGMSECIRYCAELWGCERPWAGTFIRHSQSVGDGAVQWKTIDATTSAAVIETTSIFIVTFEEGGSDT